MKPGPRRSISQADIVDAAFEILEQKGFAAVSVRGVAAALSLTPTAMYTYFPSKNALLRAMVEQVLSTLDLDAASDPAVPWRDRVQALAAGLRARLAEHTGAMVLVTSGPLDGPHALALDEVLIAGFRSERMPLADAAHAARAVRAQVLGAAALDAAERAGGASADADRAALWSDATAYPLTEAAAALELDDDAGFTWALDRLLDGFASVSTR
ncbi:TetR/AcrR family transcriptional regulator [Agromyces ramosus]|uniref:TetR/AcrR family tetracycline transcriptional repressor n=1 Tax=Agromyces ramosus TaxID=33879 RepID=A0ABU0R7Y4_9MICO|nr:TetR/AcrR family transcriptional regulator [Agromyces ramosus]MDQ0894201.1 TetR/AcrR family tetracycline transcriptional repressor [Agromyces ramosus]